MSFSWEIKVKGFGPFAKQSIGKISRDQPRARAKVAIYSGNGQGKTCLSRMFRAVEVGKNTLTDSNITQSLKKVASNSLYAIQVVRLLANSLCVSINAVETWRKLTMTQIYCSTYSTATT